eukprot:337629_1
MDAISSQQTITQRMTPKQRDLIFGYIHQIEKKYNNKLTIPESITFLFAAYYCSIECFDKIGKRIILNHDEISPNKYKRTITATEGGGDTNCYGALLLPSNTTTTHRWKFCIDKAGHGHPVIGIVDASIAKQGCKEIFHEWKDKLSYGINNLGQKFCKDGWRAYGTRLNTGDILEMILDFKKGTLSFIFNDKDYSTCHWIEKRETLNYCMAVSLYEYNQKVTLLSYEFH